MHNAHTRFGTVIDGEPRAGDRSEALIDPATGAEWGRVEWSTAHIAEAIASAQRCVNDGGWAGWSRTERADLFDEIARGIAPRADELAVLESRANGKPIAATRAEVLAASRWWQYYAALLRGLREEHFQNSPTKRTRIDHEPVGVVGLITPFNGAFSLATWKLAPALAAGNAVVLKPPVNSPGSSVILATILRDAGLPADAVHVLQGDADVGSALVSDPAVGMVSFTGSTAAAKHVASVVSGRLGRFVAEAGGKSAHLVFADADIEEAVTAVVQGVFSGSGQTCVAGSRVLVQRSIAAPFRAALVARVRRLRVGDPRDSTTHLGPIATAQQLERIEAMVDAAIAEGAEVLCGGGRPSTLPAELRGGFWFEPTVLGSSHGTESVWHEEVFGPVLTLREFGDEDEAITLANDSRYGLAAGFWTSDVRRVERVSRRLHAGTVWVNCYRGMDWETPFGGYRESGLGRENGVEGLREFQQVKSVVVESGHATDPFGIGEQEQRTSEENAS